MGGANLDNDNHKDDEKGHEDELRGRFKNESKCGKYLGLQGPGPSLKEIWIRHESAYRLRIGSVVRG